MLRKDDYATLGRLAVSKDARGRHLGERLVAQGESTVAGLWAAKKVLISSQHQVQGFYEKCGYTRTDDEEHLDEGWRHVYMSREL
ncbi:protein of unknown function [Taphrina deformans PYCC 5710]|uniref:N-acetyltransferase domain-containing protein n=1 Tax=Taphrina deformans (strain PYCC 5710 / ATCC 11124 / CBS 356.35 / IMI 108563 / JCM 9778 / NBRC 8474) TaxID=1097556 RepID=R4XBB9_TAPDE|nr:protein of unknown function [Taphrina deformans PYCC 5710]|eukprot:CCG81651.1 protein of unknown function [Taphrina deformans PYCC 5710]